MTASEANADSAGVRKHTLALAGLLAGLIGALGWEASRYIAARSELWMRVARAGTLVGDATTIRRLSQYPAAKLTLAAGSTGDLSAQVQAAMQTTQLDPACLLSILPQPPRRIAGTREAERSWQLVLDNASLNSLVSMVRRVAGTGTALKISAIHLRPRPDGPTWSADLNIAARTVER